MDFSHKGSASCFSSQCGLCNSCCGNTGGGTGRTWDHKNKYYYPGYVDENTSMRRIINTEIGGSIKICLKSPKGN